MKRSQFVLMVFAMAGLAVFAEPVKSVLGNDGIERSGGKPYKYRIEYIESTGTQWIDTKFIAIDGCIMEVMFSGKNYSAATAIIGSHNKNPGSTSFSRNQIILNSPTKVEFNKCAVYGAVEVGVNLINTFHLYYFNSIRRNRIGAIDGSVVVDTTTTHTLSPENSIWLLCNQYSTNNKTQGKLSWCKIYDANEVLVCYFIPVIDNTDEPCMYDEVSGEFFYNQGTGHFIAGPIVE